MNQNIKKSPALGAVILASALIASALSIVLSAVSLAAGNSFKLSLIFALIVLPSIDGVWFFASMVAYTISKFKGKISGWADINLRVSSLVVCAILLVAALLLTVFTLLHGTNPISTITSLLNG